MDKISPIKLNVAFQGGGAKLVSLIECAAYLQELEKGGKVIINSTSGTSAGSIVAALLSCEVDFKLVKAFLKSKEAEIESILKPKNMVKTLYSIYKGEPVYSKGSLRKLIDMVLESVEIQLFKFSDVKKPLSIVATDLNLQCKKVYSVKDTPSDLILDAIEASCALPFAFKNYKTDNYLVDGGLCENLPIEEFDNEKDVFNLAVGFIRSESNIKLQMSFFDFIGRIVSSTINHSVTRSELSDKCHGIVKLNDSVDLLDFKKAISLLDDPNHKMALETEVNNTLKTVQLAQSRAATVRSLEQAQLSKYEKQRIKLYEALSLLEHDDIEFLEKSVLITPWCLYDDTRSRQFDEVTQLERIVPRKPLKCIHLQLGLDIDDIDRKDTVVLCNGNEIEHKLFEVSGNTLIDGKNELFTSLFLFFEEELEPNQEYKILATYGIENAMKGLKTDGFDYITSVNDRRKNVTYQYGAMVIYCPSAFEAKVELKTFELESDKNSGFNFIKGSELPQSSLSTYLADGLRKDAKSSPKGWEFRDLKFMDSCSVGISVID